nr:hypothetical protein [Nitratireductor sp. OM-1]
MNQVGYRFPTLLKLVCCAGLKVAHGAQKARNSRSPGALGGHVGNQRVDTGEPLIGGNRLEQDHHGRRNANGIGGCAFRETSPETRRRGQCHISGEEVGNAVLGGTVLTKRGHSAASGVGFSSDWKNHPSSQSIPLWTAASLIFRISSSEGDTSLSQRETLACVTPMSAANSTWVASNISLRMYRIAFIGAHTMRKRIFIKLLLCASGFFFIRPVA